MHRRKRLSNSRRLSNILHVDIPSAADGSWDHGAFHTRDKSDTGSRLSPGGRSLQKPQTSFHNCTEQETCEAALCPYLLKLSWKNGAASRFLYRRQRTLLAPVRLKHLFPQAQKFGRNFRELIVGDELDGLLQIQLPEGHQANGLIGSRRPHVGQFLLTHGVHIEVCILRVLANDHALIQLNARSHEKLSALLQSPQSVRGGNTCAVRDQRSGEPMRNFPLPFGITIEQGIHHNRSPRISKQLAAQADQPSAGHAKFNAYSPIAVVVHVYHLALARAQLFHHNSHKAFRHIYSEMLDGLHQLAVNPFGDDLRFAHHQFVTFTPHHLDQDGKL